MKKIEAYQCGFCERKSFNEDSITRHEPTCVYNPATKRCQTCIYVNPEKYNTDDGSPAVHANRKCKSLIKQKFNYSYYNSNEYCSKYEPKAVKAND